MVPIMAVFVFQAARILIIWQCEMSLPGMCQKANYIKSNLNLQFALVISPLEKLE
jgi:hypothetical protein